MEADLPKIGIVLYDIESHGCLNGVYTNFAAQGEIYNEMAKLKVGTISGSDGLSGIYDCYFLENKNSLEGRWLEIKVINKAITHNKVDVYTYVFIWKDNSGKQIFEGIGFKMNERQIAVSYVWNK